jgi:hypothetical protein
MGIKQISVNKFIKWLESRGLKFIRIQHLTIIKLPARDPHRLTRNITVRTKDKDIPQFHIHTILQTLGISKTDFEKEIKAF